MKSLRRLLILSILAVIVLALPVTVLAGKKIYKAHLTQDAVVNTVQVSQPAGVGILGLSPGGVIFQVGGSNLPVDSSSTTSFSGGGGGGDISVHIHHGPAGQNGPIVVKLCGEPSPAILASCNVSKDGFMKIIGTIDKQHIEGMTAAEFLDALDNGELYIQVHSDGTPIIRGQLYEN